MLGRPYADQVHICERVALRSQSMFEVGELAHIREENNILHIREIFVKISLAMYSIALYLVSFLCSRETQLFT